MLDTEQKKTSRLANGKQIIVLLGIMAFLVILISSDFVGFLVGIRTGEIFAFALLISIIATGFVLLHKLGLDIGYKEEIEQAPR
jgi:Na+(H+)/acetate symporter ActP